MRKSEQPVGSSIFFGAVLLIFIVFAALLWLPGPTVHGGPTKRSTVGGNLRRLAGAKEQWAFEHKKTGAVPVTRQDINPYFGEHGMDSVIVPVAGERYVIGNLNQPPEAVLTRSVDKYPKGTIMRLGTNFDVEIIPPAAP